MTAIDPTPGLIPAPGPSMLRSIKAGRPPSEADVDADVRAEFGRLSQPTLFPSLYVRANETGKFIPLSDAIGAVEQAFVSGHRPTADEIKSLLSHKIRLIGVKGSPDLYGGIEQIIFWVELKRPAWRSPEGRLYPAGTLNPDQLEWHRVAARRGEHVAVIDGPEQVLPFLLRVLTAPRPSPSPGRGRP